MTSISEHPHRRHSHTDTDTDSDTDTVTDTESLTISEAMDRPAPTATGRSFTEALREKYCSTDAGVCHNSFVIDLVIRGKPGDPSKGQAELGFLRNVVLNNNNITHAGIPGLGLQSLCPNVVDLDLSNNMIDNWKEVVAVWMGLPHLKYVNLTFNTLKDHEGILGDKTLKLPAIDNLVLNRTNIEWKDVTLLGKRLSSLRELHLCANGYREIPEKVVKALSNVHCLRLNDNFLTSWVEVWKLKSLDKLSSLILSGNPVVDVFYDDESPKPCDVCLDVSRESRDVEIHAESAVHGEPAAQDNTNRDESTGSPATRNNAKRVEQAAPIQPKPVRYVGDSTAVCQNMINEIMENVCPRRSSTPSLSCTHPVTSLPAAVDPMPCEEMIATPEHIVDSEATAKQESLGVITKQPKVVPTLDIQGKLGEPGVSGSEGFVEHAAASMDEQLVTSSVNTDTQSDPDVVTVQEASEEIIGNVMGQFVIGSHTKHSAINPGRSHCTCAKIVPFASLESLCISNTEVATYQDLEGIAKFPKLKSLRVTNAKVFTPMLLEEKRKMLVACLPNVSVLNGSEVTHTEREKGEHYFLRHLRDNPERPPRYHHLEEKHGRLEDGHHIDISRGFCEWADVIFVCNNVKVHTSTVHVINPVEKLRTYIAEKVLHIPKRSFKMYHCACGPCHPEPEEEDTSFNELFLDSLPMSRYNFMHGDEIHIEIIEAEAGSRKVIAASNMTSKRD